MRPNKDRRTEIILYGLLLIPLLFAAAALAQATEQAQGLAEITAALSVILNNPSMLRWCASTPKFLMAVLVLYPLAVYCYMLDQADRHPGAEHGTAKWGNAHTLNLKYRNTKDPKENYILTENVRFSTDSHAHKHMQYCMFVRKEIHSKRLSSGMQQTIFIQERMLKLTVPIGKNSLKRSSQRSMVILSRDNFAMRLLDRLYLNLQLQL